MRERCARTRSVGAPRAVTPWGHPVLVHEPVREPLGRMLSKWWCAEKARGSGWRVWKGASVDNTEADYRSFLRASGGAH